jgi:hypothetical protein
MDVYSKMLLSQHEMGAEKHGEFYRFFVKHPHGELKRHKKVTAPVRWAGSKSLAPVLDAFY